MNDCCVSENGKVSAKARFFFCFFFKVLGRANTQDSNQYVNGTLRASKRLEEQRGQNGQE